MKDQDKMTKEDFYEKYPDVNWCRPSRWEKFWSSVKWNLFGELRIINWFIGIGIVFFLLVCYVVIHFLLKFW